MVADARLHRRGYAKRLVNPTEVVVHEVERHSRVVVLDLLGEGVSPQPYLSFEDFEKLLAVAGKDVRLVCFAAGTCFVRREALGRLRVVRSG